MREQDRALETLLADELAGRRPPDLSGQILAAARSRRTAARATAAPAPSPSARRALAVGMLLGGIVVAGAWALWDARRDTPSVALVRGAVSRGALAWETAAGASQQRALVAGDSFALALGAGDRLRNAGSDQLVLSFDRLGELVFAPHSCLEVKHVEWKPLTGGFVAGSITVSALIGAASWFGEGELIDDPTRDVVLAAKKSDEPARPLAASPTSAELTAAQERIAELEQMLGARVPVQPDTASPDATDVPAEAANEPILTGSEFDELLAQVDWREVGSAIAGYLDAQREIERLIAADERVPLELRSIADGFENQLFQHIAGVLEEGVPGETVTAKLHHPAIGTNFFDSVMAAAGLPLDADQRRTLEDLGERYTLEDAARRASYNEQTLGLERFIDEIEMQHRLFGEQRRALSADQEALLSFGELAERAGIDPFGSGYQWSKNNRAIEVTSRADLAQRAAAGYAHDLNLDDTQQARLHPMLERWASLWPAEWMERPMDHLDRKNRMHIERIRSAAHLQLGLMREMSGGLGLNAEQLATLRERVQIFVPFLSR